MTPMPDLNKLAADIHQENLKWWQDLETGAPLETPRGQKELLMISEVSEAMEGLRKGLKDDKLPHRTMVEVEVADYVIRVLDYADAHNLTLYTYSVVGELDQQNTEELLLEMVVNAYKLYITKTVNQITPEQEDHDYFCIDASRCIHSARVTAARLHLDLWGAVEEKRAYNRERADHKIENRMKEGGKKW